MYADIEDKTKPTAMIDPFWEVRVLIAYQGRADSGPSHWGSDNVIRGYSYGCSSISRPQGLETHFNNKKSRVPWWVCSSKDRIMSVLKGLESNS